jgi:hypothetical protein
MTITPARSRDKTGPGSLDIQQFLSRRIFALAIHIDTGQHFGGRLSRANKRRFMKKRSLFWASAVAVAVCSVGGWVMSDEPKKAPEGQPAGGMDPAMMEAWAKYMTPGDHHKALSAMEGKFKYNMTFKMDPTQPSQTAEGEYEGKSVFGGRFLMTMVKGPMMGDNFEGMGYLGYDNQLQKHVSVWMDNMGTGIMRSEGTCSDDCKTMTFEGEMPDIMQGGKMCKYKFVYNIKSPDEFSMRWWSPAPATGEMFESMTINYTRAK